MNMYTEARPAPDAGHLHADFLRLKPIIERHAEIVFRGRNSAEREEAVAEAVAAAFESYVYLKGRGKDPVNDFPSSMATFAVCHVRNHRRVGGRQNSKDVMSPLAQKRHGFRVERLPQVTRMSRETMSTNRDQRKMDVFEEVLHDNHRTPVPDQAAFRIDLPAFMNTLSLRDRKLAEFLAEGNSGKAAAEKFGLTPGRVTQLRQQWQVGWQHFHGEEGFAVVGRDAA